MNGKQKCAILKEIRRDIAKKNDINIRIDECTHKGECRGTCPRCEAEVKILERELEKKRKRGFQTAIAGVSAGILAASLASCVPAAGDDVKPETGETQTQIESLAGDIAMPNPEEDDETQIAERTEGEIAVTEGLIADPDCVLPQVGGEPLAENYDEEEFPLMGEPPIEEYETETEELPLAGKPAPADLEAEEPDTPEPEEELPELAGIPLMPDDFLIASEEPEQPEQSEQAEQPERSDD